VVKWREAFVLLATALAVAGCGAVPSAPDAGSAAAVPPPGTATAGIPDGSARLVPLAAAERARAAEVIDALSVRGRGPKTGYRRELFGRAWDDDAVGVLWSGNGCRTRDDILARDLDEPSKRDACVVVAGSYVDPYTGDPVRFAKADAENSPVDHLVPDSFAWQMGAAGWSAEQRLRFANDPLNLVLTTRGVNDAKSDSDPASWLPPNRDIRCAYVERFALVCVKYGLPVTPADRPVMLSQCGSG